MYGFYRHDQSGRTFVLSKSLESVLNEKLFPGDSFTLIAERSGSDLVGLQYTHPLTASKLKIVPANYVTDDSGTGIYL
jgi:isoleucyl-tRNA synthetase